MKKMKRIYSYIICAICAVCGLSSCGDFLEIKSQDRIILEDFWKDKEDIDNTVAGCYLALQSSDAISRMIVWGEGRSDEVAPGTNINQKADLEEVLQETITAMNSYANWEVFYKVINRCNTVMLYAPTVAAEDPGYTQSELRATIAEMTALRSLCYFYLIRTFRDVPFTRQAFTDDDQRMDLPATPFYDVLDSLIYDLESVKNDAVRRYPDTKPLYQTGRITQDAIYAMLCEMYLWKKDYQKCISYADLVIESKKLQLQEKRSLGRVSTNGGLSSNDERYNGFPLVSNIRSTTVYGTAYQSIFVDGNSQETIFELAFDDAPKSNNMPSNSAVGELYGNSGVDQGYMAPSSYVLNDVANDNYAVYDKKTKKIDGRIYMNCNAEREAISKFVHRDVEITLSGSEGKARYDDKFNTDNNPFNWIIYRLSDIMLLKAEALAETLVESDDSTMISHNAPILKQAFNLVSAISKRSICKYNLEAADTLELKDYNTKSLMRELVMKERQRELMFEGKRWYDLVRYSMRDNNTVELSRAIQNRDGINMQFAQNFFRKMDAIFWPYSNDEVKVNTNLKQNPSYGSGENNSYQTTK